MEEITTMNQLFNTALPITADDTSVTQKGKSKGLNPTVWWGGRNRSFNTSNGVLSFMDDTHTLYVIPNFEGLIGLLKAHGFSQDYLMAVPFAGNHVPRKSIDYWEKLKAEFRRQYTA